MSGLNYLEKKSDMKISKLALLLVLATLVLNSLVAQENTDLAERITSKKILSKEDSLAYSIAILSYNSWARDNFSPDPIVFARALIDAGNGNPMWSEEVARSMITAYVNDRQTKQAELARESYKEYIAQNEAFLARNREKSGMIVTASGLEYEIVKLGSGPKPTRDNIVKVHYTGTLIDGTEFDSSVKRNTPAQFPVSGVIAGWTEALQLMPVGSKFILYIPENLGYGARGAGDTIKPFSALIFEVELLEIVK